jgi:hypothetical protein
MCHDGRAWNSCCVRVYRRQRRAKFAGEPMTPLMELIRITGAPCRETAFGRSFCSWRRAPSSRLLACAAHPRLPTRTCVRLQRIDLCAVPYVDRIVECPIVLIGCAWRQAFIVARATVHPAVGLTRVLTAILATILTGAKTVLRTSVLLGE